MMLMNNGNPNLAKYGRKMKPSWFDRELQNNGNNMENLISAMDTTKIYRDSNRIFKDIMYRNIDMEKYGRYFFDQHFMETIYQSANDKYREYYTIQNAMAISISMLTNSPSPNMQEIKYEEAIRINYSKLTQTYEVIINKLYLTKTTGDLSYINTIANDLEQIRRDLQNIDVFNQ